MRQFRMNVAAADEYYYREAEKLISERHQYYVGKYPGQDNETYLMMMLLDIGFRLKQAESSASNASADAVLQGLVADIEETLA